MDNIKESVKSYYGEELKTSSDLKTNACCTTVNIPQKIKNILSQIHDEVLSKYYGCGLTIPNELNGLKVLDLGSGSGRDCYLLSHLVGESGKVIGVDMTDEQLAVANKHIQFHTDKFHYKTPNVSFLKGDIEELDALQIEDSSLDLIVSNCVINLSTNKKKVIADCFRKLKEGGEMYFSDVYVNKRIPKDLANDNEVYGECLGGALYWNDFLNISKSVGFIDPRVVEVSAITVQNKRIEMLLEGFEFYSVTYRLFKMGQLEPDCEDYGQAVLYKGTMEDCPNAFMLDLGHVFEKGKVHPVCGNSFLMLRDSRFREHFEFIGNFDTHFGIFPGCGSSNPFSNVGSTEKLNPSGCC